MKKLLCRFWNDEDGVTAIEYGLIAALIAVTLIGGATIAGTELNSIFNFVGTEMQNAQGGGP